MNILILGLAIGTFGKILLGVAVLRVHLGILHEHKIDNVVLRSIKREQMITLFGLALILIGFFLELFFYLEATGSAWCSGAECAAQALESILR